MRALRMSLMSVLVVAVGMGAAVGARMVTDRPASAAKADQQAVKKAAGDTLPFVLLRPGGKQLALTKTVKPRSGGFTVKAPATATALPDLPSRSLLALSLRGDDDISVMFLVSKVSDGETDPVVSLRAKRPATHPRLRALRRTQVAGEPAATTDNVLKGKHRIRQIRVAHGGQMYGVAISYYAGDRAGLDTAFAMLASWKWARAS